MFNKDDANQAMINLQSHQADRWVRIANQEYERRKKLGGKDAECRRLATKLANSRLLGAKE